MYRVPVPSIEVTHRIPRPRHEVWPALADLSSHVTWMQDAESLRFVGEHTTGVGTRMEVKTRVGPFRTLDSIEVTDWDEGSAIGVAHRGLVRGRGGLSLRSDGDETIVVWAEDLTFPWWLGGPIVGWLAKPMLARIWKGNLARFAASLSDL